jgi:MFS transporter, PPP family, 3-phenylpropionic acid transporter
MSPPSVPRLAGRTRTPPTRDTLALGGAFLLVGAAAGATLTFVAPVLATRGFSADSIGFLLAISSLATVVSVPVLGHVGDVILGRRRALQAASLLAAVAMLWFGAPAPLLIVAAGMVAWWLLQAALTMLIDSIALIALGGRRDRYGRFRLLESLAFAIAALVAGILYDLLGYAFMYVLFGAICLFLVLMLRWVAEAPRANLAGLAAASPIGSTRAAGAEAKAVGPPEAEPHRVPGGPTSRRAAAWSQRLGSVAVCLRVAPGLPRVLVAIALLSFATLWSGTFLPLRLRDLGAPPSIIALSATVSALFEIPIMLRGDSFVRLLGLRGFFGLGALLYATAFGSWMVIENPALIVVTRVLTGISYGAFTVSGVVAVGMLLPDELQATGQAMLRAAAASVAILAYLGGGVAYGHLGHTLFFGIGVAAAAVASVAAWRWMPSRAVRLAQMSPSEDV